MFNYSWEGNGNIMFCGFHLTKGSFRSFIMLVTFGFYVFWLIVHAFLLWRPL